MAKIQNIHNLESPKPAQASKKTNKPIDAPNLHRHQKKQKNKPLDAPNLHRHQKTKKTKISRNYGSTSE